VQVAFAADQHGTVGVDLVATCTNDLIACGAEPLFFQDYFATGEQHSGGDRNDASQHSRCLILCACPHAPTSGKLDVDRAAAVVEGIAEGCRQTGCGLLGGEACEMPGCFVRGEYALAGFAVGGVRRSGLLPASLASAAARGVGTRTAPAAAMAVQPGDVLLGLRSSGVHASGFSLARLLVAQAGEQQQEHQLGGSGVLLGGAKEVLQEGDAGLALDGPCPWEHRLGGPTLAQALLAPTRSYAACVLPLLRAGGLVKAAAHVAAGGLVGSLPRALPPHCSAALDLGAWALPPVFAWLQGQSGLGTFELASAFNCGVGLVLVVGAGAPLAEAVALLERAGEVPVVVGSVGKRCGPEGPQVVLRGDFHANSLRDTHLR